jgi:tetratricopeptide (TPR) repeat protein
LGDVRNAIEYYESALAISREIGDRSGEGIALWNLAFAHYQLSQYVRATALAEQALAILTAIEHPNAEMVRRALEEWRNQSTGQEQATPKPASPSDK